MTTTTVDNLPTVPAIADRTDVPPLSVAEALAVVAERDPALGVVLAALLASSERVDALVEAGTALLDNPTVRMMVGG